MSPERRQSILSAVEAEEREGRRWNNVSIHRLVGGRYPHVSQVLREVRAARAAEHGGVAVAEIEAEEPPVADLDPDAPLAQALLHCEQARATEQALAEEHTRLKRQRQALDTQFFALETAKPLQGVAGDAQRRQQVADLARERTALEEARAGVVVRLRQANLAWSRAQAEAQDQLDQAKAACRTMRYHQAHARGSSPAYAKADAWEEAARWQAKLGALAGIDQAALLAADPARKPAWMGMVL